MSLVTTPTASCDPPSAVLDSASLYETAHMPSYIYQRQTPAANKGNPRTGHSKRQQHPGGHHQSAPSAHIHRPHLRQKRQYRSDGPSSQQSQRQPFRPSFRQEKRQQNRQK